MKPKKSWKKVAGVLFFIALNVAVIAATAINEFGNSENAAELSTIQIKWWWLVPAVLALALATLGNVYNYVSMIKQAYSDHADRPLPKKSAIWKTAWRTVMLGKYYDNITPAAIGGQPFQIYYMRKESGLPAGYATSIPIFGMVAGQMGFLVLVIPCFIIATFSGFNPALMTLAWIGLLFFAFWPVMILGFSFFPKPTTKFLQFIIKILAKIKLVKNRKKALDKIETEVAEYTKAIGLIIKTRKLSIKILGLSVFYQAMIAIVPFFVLTAFGGKVDFFNCFMTSLAVISSVYFVPTPGNAGAAEGTFYLVFSALAKGYVFWAMLVWRFLSYYIYIIVGPLIYIRMHFEKK